MFSNDVSFVLSMYPINPPAKDPTVLKIFNKHQEYKQNVKEDPSSENVALEKKYFNLYSEWRTRDLMYKKLSQHQNYKNDLKAMKKKLYRPKTLKSFQKTYLNSPIL